MFEGDNLMSIYVMLPVFETTKLTSSEKLVALSLAENAHDDGTDAYPSISTTAAKTGLSDRTITRLLQSLVAKEVLVVQRKATNNFPTTYKFLLSPDGKYLAIDAPWGDTMTPPNESRGDIDDARGDIDDSSGCHGVTQTVIEPSREPSNKKDYTPEFESWYKIYPKPVNKKGTFGCWNATLRERGGTVESLMLATSVFANEMLKEGREKQFIMNSTTFLGPGERWREYLPATIDPEVLALAWAWDAFDSQPGPGTILQPDFPRPQNSEGYLLDGNGRAYYRDPMQPEKRRYLDDE
jgi:hypothetical protein